MLQYDALYLQHGDDAQGEGQHALSFPLRLNMCHYVEKTLMPQQYKEDREKRQREKESERAESGSDENANEKAEATLDADIEECYE